MTYMTVGNWLEEIATRIIVILPAISSSTMSTISTLSKDKVSLSRTDRIAGSVSGNLDRYRYHYTCTIVNFIRPLR